MHASLAPSSFHLTKKKKKVGYAIDLTPDENEILWDPVIHILITLLISAGGVQGRWCGNKGSSLRNVSAGNSSINLRSKKSCCRSLSFNSCSCLAILFTCLIGSVKVRKIVKLSSSFLFRRINCWFRKTALILSHYFLFWEVYASNSGW